MKNNLIFIKVFNSIKSILIFMSIINFIISILISTFQENINESIMSKIIQYNFTTSNKIGISPIKLYDLKQEYGGVYDGGKSEEIDYLNTEKDKSDERDNISDNTSDNPSDDTSDNTSDNTSDLKDDKDDNKKHLTYIISGSAVFVILIILVIVICNFIRKNKDLKDRINKISFAEGDNESKEEKNEEE